MNKKQRGWLFCCIFIMAIFSGCAASTPNVDTSTNSAPVGNTPSAPVAMQPEVSAPALAAKAPGAPGYGLQFTTSRGKIMLTSLRYDPTDRKPTVSFYRIAGPAGMGPYRAGMTLGSLIPERPMPATNPMPSAFYNAHFPITDIKKGSPAYKAGMRPDKYGMFYLLSVDGSNFGWDKDALVFHISNSPEIEVYTLQINLWLHTSYDTYRIKTEKLQTPVDPADGILEKIAPDQEIAAWFHKKETWKDLLILRSKQDRFTALPVEIDGQKLWVVCAEGVPGGNGKPPRSLEFWKEDPAAGNVDTGIADVWPVPPDGVLPGRILRMGGHWYRLKTYTEDTATHRLVQFEVDPWKADVETLLSGRSLADQMGAVQLSGVKESLEETANDSLIEWKTRNLPDLLQTAKAPDLEDMVIRIEKGLLALDLQVRSIREKADAQARAQVSQQANAQKPGASQTYSSAYAASTNDTERLADVLSQREAILQAVLASTKQALAQVRR